MHHPNEDTKAGRRAGLLASCMLFFLVCTPFTLTAGAVDYEDAEPCAEISQLQFDGELANASVQWQVDLGPRLPGSNVSATFREAITSDLEALGYEVTTQSHDRYNMTLTNLFARWTPNGSSNGQLVLSAHYDSRNIADQDANETNRSRPVPGANDAASGVAVLLELARHIPQMELDHEVVLFFNDAEDQEQRYTLGAEAWAENLTEEQIKATHAFVLLDMIGDADLQLHDIAPGNETLKSRVQELGSSLGMVNGTVDCNGSLGSDIIQYATTVYVLDDHVHAHNLGIPAIDLMDTSYGEPKPYTFGSLWHTMEDTPDKVSAESLAHVGRLVELGLRTNAFVSINSVGDDAPLEVHNATNVEPEHEPEQQDSRVLFIVATVGLGSILGLLVVVELKGKQ